MAVPNDKTRSEADYDPAAFFAWKDMVQNPALDALDWLIQIAANEKDDVSLSKWVSKRETLTQKYSSNLYVRK